LIKLADRLHNMRTISHLPPAKQREKSEETLEIYAPLANRLGIYRIKSELEDLAFSILEPAKYHEIRKMVAERLEKRQAYLTSTVKVVRRELRKVGITAQIEGRPKHFYSIYQKMVTKNRSFDEIYDLIGIRVLVDSVKECYAALGAIHALWKPVPGRFKDYIGMPKFNMYQSLQTTVIGNAGRPLEIQIRTRKMHKAAEYGIAAHWSYKEGRKQKNRDDEKLSWLRQIVEWQSELKDPHEFMENLKIDLFEDEVFVFTPKGDVLSLPRGATPLDFAYAIHTEVGHSCIGAKVDKQIVPLEYELRMGDIVDIQTTRTPHGPGKDWLKIVKTSRARNKIRQWFAKERQGDYEQQGREMVNRMLRQKGLSLASFPADLLEDTLKRLNFPKLENLYASVGSGKVSAQKIITRLVDLARKVRGEDSLAEIKPDGETGRSRQAQQDSVRVRDLDGALVKLATCCNPVPRDNIIGFVTRGKGVSVHRRDCPNARDISKDAARMIDVYWHARRGTTFPVEIEVESLDRHKLLTDVTSVISDAGVNIRSATASVSKDQTAVFRFVFDVGNSAHLENILKEIRKIDAVFGVQRVFSG
ncbi:MAG: RelA/SpoT family protein, partial [Terriglobia bacterium]